MNSMLVVLGVAAVLAATCTAYPGGAPGGVCSHPDMSPKHGNAQGQQNSGQYSLVQEPVADNPGVYKVTLSGPSFKGFIVRASTPQGVPNSGQFISGPGVAVYQEMPCTEQNNVAVTHTDNQLKPSITLYYMDGNNGEYKLQGTVVIDFDNFVTYI